MKVFTRTLAISFIITLLAASGAGANPAWWTILRTAGGGYYSKVEHPDISLEKEVLIYARYNYCEAHFLFKNNSRNPVSMKVGFPIKVIIPRTFDSGDIHVKTAEGYFMNQIKISEGGSVWYEKDYVDWDQFEDSHWKRFEKLGPETEELNTIKSWFIETLAITQDGRSIDIESVWMESARTKPDELVMQFHFLHQLDFLPDSYSHVVVKYTSFVTALTDMTVGCIDWRYILGTGRTWKGPIRDIYFLAPGNLKPELPEPFEYAGGFKKNQIYYAGNYEPQETDGIKISVVQYDESGGYIANTVKEPEAPAQNAVALIGASSFLRQRTWINSSFTCVVSQADASIYQEHVNFFGEDFLKTFSPPYTIENLPVHCKDIGFGPLSLFDGLPASAWCEGVEGNGIGEWVEFELKEDISGISVYNGFTKSPFSAYVSMILGGTPDPGWDLDMDEESLKKIEEIETIYGNNNRVKHMEFVSSDGAVKRAVELEDTRERQDFDDIDLPKGIYKVYIRDIYKGAKWDDTCLGEITFHSASARGIVEQDAFLKEVLDEHFAPVQE